MRVSCYVNGRLSDGNSNNRTNESGDTCALHATQNRVLKKVGKKMSNEDKKTNEIASPASAALKFLKDVRESKERPNLTVEKSPKAPTVILTVRTSKQKNLSTAS